MPLKIMTVVGTRPEIIRLSRIIPTLDQHTRHVLVHTGQNFDYELNQIFFEDLGIRSPDHYLGVAGSTASVTIGNILIKIDRVLETERPDAFLVLGDTNSATAVIAAKRRKIPVFHMEAGNRCFDERVPEEINRRLVDHLSDINMPYSERARELLLREGFPPDRIIKTGSPMYEVLCRCMPKIRRSPILRRLKLRKNGYFVISVHREENVDNKTRLGELLDTLNAVAKMYGKRLIVSVHPRTRKRLEAHGAKLNHLIELHKPFAFTEYLSLQLNALAVLSDSGTVTEEAAILDLPAINLRDTHERYEGMEETAAIMTGLSRERVLAALSVLLSHRRNKFRQVRVPIDYAVPNVAQKVLRILLSYTDYVNRTVWSKHLTI